MQELRDTYQRLLAQPPRPFKRYLFGRFNAERHLAGLVGPRGVGKTTLMLQWIRETGDPSRCMYASLDHIYFSTHRLLDFVRDMHQVDGRTRFFLDEAHMYPGWNREIKNIYDSFPDFRLVFSGSSSLDLVKGQYDLSRRGVLYRMNGLSLREFIQFRTGAVLEAVGWEDLLARYQEISRELALVPRILGLFQDYLRTGYYPFYFGDPGGKSGLRAPGKVLLENANLYYAVASESGFAPSLGSLRETFFVNSLRGAGLAVQYSKQGDYRAKGWTFEIGGDGKTARQLKGLKNALLVRDGPLTAAPGDVPLYLFGFLW